MCEYDVNEYLKKKRKRQQRKDKVLVALFIINVVLVFGSILVLDSRSWIPSIVCACGSLYLLAFSYANTPKEDE